MFNIDDQSQRTIWRGRAETGRCSHQFLENLEKQLLANKTAAAAAVTLIVSRLMVVRFLLLLRKNLGGGRMKRWKWTVSATERDDGDKERRAATKTRPANSSRGWCVVDDDDDRVRIRKSSINSRLPPPPPPPVFSFLSHGIERQRFFHQRQLPSPLWFQLNVKCTSTSITVYTSSVYSTGNW